MNNKRKVVILGGGSAGWMTAAYLAKAFNQGIDITVVESPNIGSVGVGEATFSYIHLFFEFLGLHEEDWMPECNAGYKMAIRFVNWNAQGRDFYHPFQRFDIIQGRSIIEWWLKLKRDSAPFDQSCFSVPAICNAKKSPRYMDGRVFDSKVNGQLGPSNTLDKPQLIEDLQIQYPYAYHFDASLLAKFLTKYAMKLGVKRIADDVVDVPLTESGFIRELQTKENGAIQGDLFVDCTGFRGLLINKTLGEPFISYTDSLPCDCAIALQVPSNPAVEGVNPYTTATALSSGWVWDIPLFHRTGTGYVYSSAHISPEDAEKEFRQYLGKRGEGIKAAHIKMRVGRDRNSWVKNCVAIGLSSGFVEPLESTGIFFIQNGIEQLVSCFPRSTFDEERVKSYNTVVAGVMDGVREFLTLHYAATTRNDTPFWKATKHDLVLPEGLADRLKLWKKQLPTERSINPNFHGFSPYSYSCMLLGLGHLPEASLTALDYLPDEPALAAFDRIQKQTRMTVDSLPPLYEYLSSKYRPQQREMAAAAMAGA